MHRLTPLIPGAWVILLTSSGYSADYPEETKRMLEGLMRGVCIDFTGNRNVSRKCDNLRITKVDEEKVNAVIEADCIANKKAGPFDQQPFKHFSCSPIGAVPKRELGKIRVIHHLSFPRGGDSINASTAEIHHSLGTFDQATAYMIELGPGCWLIKLDVEAAYKQIPVRPEDWPLLGFKWKGKWYYERVLPFGLRSSCRLWELYATALQRILERCCGIKYVVHYVDDFLFVVKGFEAAKKQLASALRICTRLGVPIAASKTEGPTTCLTFLGIQIDSVAMTASLSDERMKRLHSLLGVWEKKTEATITELHSLEGTLQWCTTVVRPGRAFLSRLRTWRKEKGKIAEGPHALTEEVRLDLRWWREFARDWNGVSIFYERDWLEADKIELFTDACERGYGCRYGNRWIEGEWSQDQLNRSRNPNAPNESQQRSMPFLELLALIIAAATWAPLWKGKKIRFVTDCVPVAQSVNKRISASSSRNQELIRSLSLIAAKAEFDFDCKWIAGVENRAADFLSRGDLSAFFAEVPTADRQRTIATPLPPFGSM